MHHHHLKFRCMLMSRIVGCTKPQAASRPKIDPAGGTLWNQISLRVCGPGRNERLEQQLLMDNLHAEPLHLLFGAYVSSVKQAGGPDFPKSGSVNLGSFPVCRRIQAKQTFAFQLSLIFIAFCASGRKCTHDSLTYCTLAVKWSVKKREGPPGVIN